MSLNGKNQLSRKCNPYPFRLYHDTHRYIEGDILDVPESVAGEMLEPCHEYTDFIQTDETRMLKFSTEVVRFAAACMNCRTNGTIHFGIGDKPDFTHGEVLGVNVKDKNAFTIELKSALVRGFEGKHREAAQLCIKSPRFVLVLTRNMASSGKYVIEVDVEPRSTICKEEIYHTFIFSIKKDNDKETKPQFFVRDGGSTRDLFSKPIEEYNQFVSGVAKLAKLRKQAEDEILVLTRSNIQGLRLIHTITGGSKSLDESSFDHYVIVTNKSHPPQLESMGFLIELNPFVVLDFDPESSKQGLQHYFTQHRTVNSLLPQEYKQSPPVEDESKSTQPTSWIFCNGGYENEAPSDLDKWYMEKGASVEAAVHVLSHDVLPNKRVLVIFLLLSDVSEKNDPLIKTYSTIVKHLKDRDQFFCICDSKNGFTSWRDKIFDQYRVSITDKCVYELSLAEVNDTILSLSSKHQTKHVLSSVGGSKVFLDRNFENSLDTLDVLCVNQCVGQSEDKLATEEDFYKGKEVSWWNFYYSEQPGSTPFIKRDKLNFMVEHIPDMCSRRRACVLFNLLHAPRCGGTTLAKHVLWILRDKFRCAVLKDRDFEFPEVAEQVVNLLTYKNEKHLPQVPVLLMVDQFGDKEEVLDLQKMIEKECMKKNIQSRSAQVIILNCMRSESADEIEINDTIFLKDNLSDNEKKLFEDKLVELEETHKNAQQTFDGFMFIKNNFTSNKDRNFYVKGLLHTPAGYQLVPVFYNHLLLISQSASTLHIQVVLNLQTQSVLRGCSGSKS
ncbi:sterile alpha motif domain-containing protein 9-like [Antennarius striatus]|uniref:sterile alpha motif domain-containing protein 9-like n=1 Tax=Antennarius striatus TaxID=241820 RepID=UPI0035B215D8